MRVLVALELELRPTAVYLQFCLGSTESACHRCKFHFVTSLSYVRHITVTRTSN